MYGNGAALAWLNHTCPALRPPDWMEGAHCRTPARKEGPPNGAKMNGGSAAVQHLFSFPPATTASLGTLCQPCLQRDEVPGVEKTSTSWMGGVRVATNKVVGASQSHISGDAFIHLSCFLPTARSDTTLRTFILKSTL